MKNEIFRFREAIIAAGLTPPAVITPGKFHRFPGFQKRSSNRSGWCILFSDGQGGCFGDWSTGLSQKWVASRNKRLTQYKCRAFSRRAKEAKAKADFEQRQKMENAAARAKKILAASVPAPNDFPYLIRKGIQAHGARLYKGRLILPVFNFHGELTSLQFIDKEGNKRLLSGGQKKGCVIPLPSCAFPRIILKNHAHKFFHFMELFMEKRSISRIVICEGWATGCTLAETHQNALVLTAIDSGNLEPAAIMARNFWPSFEIVIAGDDDRLKPGNPGATKARNAAIAADALLALPQWPNDAPDYLTDFNDLAVWLASRGQ